VVGGRGGETLVGKPKLAPTFFLSSSGSPCHPMLRAPIDKKGGKGGERGRERKGATERRRRDFVDAPRIPARERGGKEKDKRAGFQKERMRRSLQSLFIRLLCAVVGGGEKGEKGEKKKRAEGQIRRGKKKAAKAREAWHFFWLCDYHRGGEKGEWGGEKVD